MILSSYKPLKAKEAAEWLGVPVRTFYALGIPGIRYTPRCTRWELAELQAYKDKCRYTSIKLKPAGASCSTVSLADRDTALRDCFRKVGVELKPKSTIAKKRLGSTALQLVSNQEVT